MKLHDILTESAPTEIAQKVNAFIQKLVAANDFKNMKKVEHIFRMEAERRGFRSNVQERVDFDPTTPPKPKLVKAIRGLRDMEFLHLFQVVTGEKLKDRAKEPDKTEPEKDRERRARLHNRRRFELGIPLKSRKFWKDRMSRTDLYGDNIGLTSKGEWER